MVKIRTFFKFILVLTILSVFTCSVILFKNDSSIKVKFEDFSSLTTPSKLSSSKTSPTPGDSTPSQVSKTKTGFGGDVVECRGESCFEARKTKSPRVESRVLLLYSKETTKAAKSIRIILDSLRVATDALKYRENNSLPFTTIKDGETVGKYCLLVIVDGGSYFNEWPASVREQCTTYTQAYNVTTVFFSIPSQQLDVVQANFLSFAVNSTNITNMSISAKLNLHYSKNNVNITINNLSSTWHLFRPIDPTTSFDTISTVSYRNHSGVISHSPCIVIDRDSGPHKIFIGSPVSFWMTKIVFMDILRIFSRTRVLRFNRRRWVMIDIDDIFVAPEGRKMNTSDVQELVKKQEQLRKFVPGLTFNLGYCGKFFETGTPAEVQGNAELVRQAGRFWWFPHIYNHYQPHRVTGEVLKSLMTLNKQFAANHSLPIENSYSVSPHHSGVYPVVEPLYLHWREVWNISVVSTEEYPNLYPEHMRRGFIHSGIMVLPRQTCKLYTQTISYSTPGLRESLVTAANGGSVFNTILSNPISIFMTHITNYATDRLALDLFEQLFQFIHEYTNLEMLTDRPLALGRRYFEIFPEDKTPVWTNPCAAKRHKEIYPPGKNCSRLPSLIILGPQKSGSTALYSFLKQHRLVESNTDTRDHYEEVQFFSNETLYNYGVEWYMDQFKYPTSDNQVLFEKSASYFTHSLSPIRIKALLPKVKMIIILQDPVIRAYSWYQHMRAHKSPIALKYSFSHVIGINQSNKSLDPGVASLRSHCLNPGLYHEIILRWFQHFPSKQFLFIDGGGLIDNPASVLDTVQTFIAVEQHLDYSTILKYNKAKGFFCVDKHCLGPGKGRKYPELEQIEISYLKNFYRTSNINLSKMLNKLKMPLPKWLKV